MMKKKLKEIPEFNSIEEEAVFWDTHSIEDYADMKPAHKDVLSVRLDPEIKEVFNKLAEEEYSSPSTVARRVLSEYAKSEGVFKRVNG